MLISRTTRGVIILLLLVIGIELSQLLGHAYWPISRAAMIVLLIAVIAACIPPLTHRLGWCFDRLRHPTRRAAALTSIAIALLSMGFLYSAARVQHRSFTLKYQDEFSYAI